ncbi:TRAP transporter small permease [Ancylobacter terrae]|uniref:TRAP transporter small permease n=1 Tax=Ancylobacter sp. sgz301288 TaxID=3342077 RepID=UPI00385EAE83
MSEMPPPPPGPLGRAIDLGFRGIEVLLVGLLGVMVVLVFGNVVMRYVFDSGITIADEMSRLLFVWVTFLGAITVMRQKGHLGVDMFVLALPRTGRWLCRIVSDVLSLGCAVLLAVGAWDQTLLNLGNLLPVSELSTAYVYAAAFASGVGLTVLILGDLIELVRGGPGGAAIDVNVVEGVS